MRSEAPKKRLCIYLDMADQRGEEALAEVVVEHAREEGLAGATAVSGIEGFGASGRVHALHVFRRSKHFPVIVQIVDEEDRIRSFLPVVHDLVGDSLVTIDDIDVVMYRGAAAPPALDDDA
jgi:PII-like signaling protein